MTDVQAIPTWGFALEAVMKPLLRETMDNQRGPAIEAFESTCPQAAGQAFDAACNAAAELCAVIGEPHTPVDVNVQGFVVHSHQAKDTDVSAEFVIVGVRAANPKRS